MHNMNDYQKELWKKRQEYELAHKDNSKLPAKPKKKKKKVKSNTDNYVTGKVKQTTNKATKDAKNKAHTQEFSTNTEKIRQAKNAKEAGDNIISKTRHKVKKKAIKHSDLYLAHHGVEGQKWGKRNGPPYPLDSSISTGHSLKKKNKDQSSIKKDKKHQRRDNYTVREIKRFFSNKNDDLITVRVSDSNDDNYHIDLTDLTINTARHPFRTLPANMKIAKDDRIKSKVNLSPVINGIQVTGPNNYSTRVIERTNNKKFDKYNGYITDIDYDSATKTFKFTFDDPDAGNHKPVSYKGAVNGSANYKDKLIIKTDDWGSPTDSSILRDFYDISDGEYLGSKTLNKGG